MTHFFAAGVKDSYCILDVALYWYHFCRISYGCYWTTKGCSYNLHVFQLNIAWPFRSKQLHFSGSVITANKKFFKTFLTLCGAYLHTCN